MSISADEYRSWDAVEMARLVRSGQVTPAELADAARALMAERSDLGAVAAHAPATPPADVPPPGPAGPLAGVPFAVKELIGWPGLPWTFGSRLFAGHRTEEYSPYAARIRDAGLQVLGSTTSSEFGLLGSTETALHGVTGNPWRVGVSAGGSSGGSAALVAAGVLPMAHGDDAGGSLRVPAALTGVVGFKPTNQRPTPVGPEMPGLGRLVVEHCISRTVRDSAAFLAATERTGADAVHPPVGVVRGPARDRLRIAVLGATLMGAAPHPAVARELRRAADLCASLGHDVVDAAPLDVSGPALSRGFFGAAAQTMAVVAASVTPLLGRPPGPEELEPFTLELIEWGATLGPDEDAVRAAAFADGTRAYLRLFERADVVLSPTVARPPWPVGHLSPDAGREVLIRRTEEAVGYTPIHNMSSCPGMSLPLGQDDGLPVGMHIAARPGADALLLALAYELEQAAPWPAAPWPGGA
ncbi:amidase [Blastococcus xanthinilyticus]|nr:amidase family protein [Blastococcus xanthinilyticus]